MVALDPPTVYYVPLAEATNRMKTVPLESGCALDSIVIGAGAGVPGTVTVAPIVVGRSAMDCSALSTAVVRDCVTDGSMYRVRVEAALPEL